MNETKLTDPAPTGPKPVDPKPPAKPALPEQPELFVRDPMARRSTPFQGQPVRASRQASAIEKPPAAEEPSATAKAPETLKPAASTALADLDELVHHPVEPRVRKLTSPVAEPHLPLLSRPNLADPPAARPAKEAKKTVATTQVSPTKPAQPTRSTKPVESAKSAQRSRPSGQDRPSGQHAPQRVFVFGATSAIAMATQRLLVAKCSTSFFLVARHADRLETVAADLRVHGATNVVTVAADLDDTAAHPGLIAQGIEALGGMDLALLAHGVLGDQHEAESSYRATEAILLTNVLSPISLLTWLGNYCEREGHGCLAIISSVAGDRGRQSNYVYGTSKAALTAFVSGLRNRLDRHGVNVLTIKPGFVITPMTAGMKLGPLAAKPHVVAEGIVSAIQKRRDVVYLPFFWRYIMAIIKAVPERIFKGLNT
jgi:short-subunit dehydrogenase